MYLLLVFILAVKSTLLLALFAGKRRAIFLLRIGAALALVPNKGCNDITVLTGWWFAILLHIEFTLFANGASISFAVNKLLLLSMNVCYRKTWLCGALLTFPAGILNGSRCIWQWESCLCIPIGKWKHRKMRIQLRTSCHFDLIWHVQELKNFTSHHTPCTIVGPAIVPQKDDDWNNANKQIMPTFFRRTCVNQTVII